MGKRRKSGGVRGASIGSADVRKESPEEYLKKLMRTVGKKERAKLLAQKYFFFVCVFFLGAGLEYTYFRELLLAS